MAAMGPLRKFFRQPVKTFDIVVAAFVLVGMTIVASINEKYVLPFFAGFFLLLFTVAGFCFALAWLLRRHIEKRRRREVQDANR
jgi:membrane protein implicated in regulation of membrane protease activity